MAGHNQFCPIAMASDILCTRWTLMLIRELLLGTRRFNELRRGLPRMSPALLSKRLKDLEAAGVVMRRPLDDDPAVYEYHLTKAGEAAAPIIEAVGDWGHRWVDTHASLAHLDVDLLMWNLRRNINPFPLPRRRSTIQIIYPDLPPAKRKWWLLVEPGEDTDLCMVDPGFDVDLYITTDLRTMTEIWMGYSTVERAIAQEKLVSVGDRDLERTLEVWLGSSLAQPVEKCVA